MMHRIGNGNGLVVNTWNDRTLFVDEGYYLGNSSSFPTLISDDGTWYFHYRSYELDDNMDSFEALYALG